MKIQFPFVLRKHYELVLSEMLRLQKEIKKYKRKRDPKTGRFMK